MLNPKYEYGSAVRLITNVRNDGSFPGSMKGDMLVRRGEIGYIRQAGMHLQEQVIYQVHFMDRNLMIGCKEQELIDASLPWVANAFEYGDKAKLAVSLSSQGEILASKGSVVSVLAVLREQLDSVPEYRIQIGELDLVVPERAVVALTEQEQEALNDECAA